MSDITEFYSGTVGFTSPGNHADALAGLPADPAALAEVAHGLIAHEHMADMYGFELTAERRASVHVRPVRRLLDRIVAEDGRPQDIAPDPSARVPGNYRHFTVFTVAALRAHGRRPGAASAGTSAPAGMRITGCASTGTPRQDGGRWPTHRSTTCSGRRSASRWTYMTCLATTSSWLVTPGCTAGPTSLIPASSG